MLLLLLRLRLLLFSGHDEPPELPLLGAEDIDADVDADIGKDDLSDP